MMEKTEEQIAREKDAVTAMKNAQANMGKALDRIATLESALRQASVSIGRLKGFIAPGAYQYGGQESCQGEADKAVQAIAKVLA